MEEGRVSRFHERDFVISRITNDGIHEFTNSRTDFSIFLNSRIIFVLFTNHERLRFHEFMNDFSYFHEFTNDKKPIPAFTSPAEGWGLFCEFSGDIGKVQQILEYFSLTELRKT